MNTKFISILLFILGLLSLSVSARVIDLSDEEATEEVVVSEDESVAVEDSALEAVAVNAQMVVEGYEWGPAVPRVIVEFDDEVTGFDKDTFTVKTADVVREVVDVYNSDEAGNRQESATNYLTFELTVKTFNMWGFSNGEASPFSFDFATFLNSWVSTYVFELGLVENKSFKVGDEVYTNWEGFTQDIAKNYIVPETAGWKKDSFTLKDQTLQRASFTPEGAATDGVKNPLIIWLHGAGEGGRDVDIALLGNEVLALSRETIQKYFTTETIKGAYVLAVQTPTMWMDKGDGTYNDSITGSKQISCYDAVLFAAIKDYVKSNPDIDTKRIYLGGCSNGGYMTMNLMFEHGDFFTAFYPICEAYMNKNISEEMISQVKNYNIWFVHSEDDQTVNPLESSVPAFYRLLNAGAKNVHYTFYDHVRGTDDPNAIYQGHYSWVYAFNDQVNKEFDNAKVLEDFENVTIEAGKVTSQNNYLRNANCQKDGNMWTWLAAQSK